MPHLISVEGHGNLVDRATHMHGREFAIYFGDRKAPFLEILSGAGGGRGEPCLGSESLLLAVVVGAVASYAIAFIWYAVLFKNQWMRLTGVTEMKPSLKVVVLALIGSWFTSWVLDHAIIFGNAYLHTSGVSGGLMCGFFNWLGFFAPVTMMGVLYEKRSWRLWALDNGFWLLTLLAMGMILSSWT